MCRRYTYNFTWAEIVALYRLTLPDEQPPGLKPSYNVAPTHVIPIIRPAPNGRELVMAGWGLQPHDTINARAETIRTAPAYREPFEKRRCLVPATGWYEWQDVGEKEKRPMHLRPMTTPFAFAGVWGVWQDDGGRSMTGFSIVTTTAALSVSQYHSRMPVLLDDHQFDEWMRGMPDQAVTLLTPYPGAIEAWEVGAEVGDVKNNRPELMERVRALP